MKIPVFPQDNLCQVERISKVYVCILNSTIEFIVKVYMTAFTLLLAFHIAEFI